jgi:antitoxin ChpS
MGGDMASTRLRQQGGAVVLTIPSEIAARAGWTVGIELDVTAEGESVNIVPVTRVPRGRRTVAQLLAGIDQQEIQQYNEEAADGLNDAPQGREHI